MQIDQRREIRNCICDYWMYPQIHSIKGLSGQVFKGIIQTLMIISISLKTQWVKNLPVMQETWIWSLGQEDYLEEEIATHSSILTWRIPLTEEPNRLQSINSQRLDTSNHTLGFAGGVNSTEPPANAGNAGSIPESGRSPRGGKSNLFQYSQYSCQENPMDRGAQWATVHRVAKSWKKPKQLNMHTHKHTLIIHLIYLALFFKWKLRRSIFQQVVTDHM